MSTYIPPQELLDQCKSKGLIEALVIGITFDGDVHIASSHGTLESIEGLLHEAQASFNGMKNKCEKHPKKR
jgi:hypothetical protein